VREAATRDPSRDRGLSRMPSALTRERKLRRGLILRRPPGATCAKRESRILEARAAIFSLRFA